MTNLPSEPMENDLELARRKERLIAHAAAQRETIAGAFRALERPIVVIDRGVAATRFLRAHPVLVGAAVAALVVFRRRSIGGVVMRGLALWRILRSLTTWSGRIGLAMRRAGAPRGN